MIRGTVTAQDRDLHKAIDQALALTSDGLTETPVIISVTAKAIKVLTDDDAYIVYTATVEFGDKDAWYSLNIR